MLGNCIFVQLHNPQVFQWAQQKDFLVVEGQVQSKGALEGRHLDQPHSSLLGMGHFAFVACINSMMNDMYLTYCFTVKNLPFIFSDGHILRFCCKPHFFQFQNHLHPAPSFVLHACHCHFPAFSSSSFACTWTNCCAGMLQCKKT